MASIDKKTLQSSAALTAASTTGSRFSLEKRQRKFVGVLVVSACNAATTVTAKIQHSHDGSTWFDLCSFAPVVGAAGSEAVHINETSVHVLTHVRSVVALAGAALAATVEINICFEQ